MEYCVHGRPCSAREAWDDYFDKYSIYCIPQDYCWCTPPSPWQIRRVEEQTALENTTRVEEEARKISRQKISRSVGSKDADGSDESAGRWYFVTFTNGDKDFDPHDLLLRTRKVIKSKMTSPSQWCYSLELTQKGVPHTHLVFYTTKYIEYKKIGAFNKGFIYDIAREEHEGATRRYTTKVHTKPSEEWLKSHDLDRAIWHSDNFQFIKQSPEIISLPVI